MTLILNGSSTSAAAPAITGADTDTGIYYPAANQVGIATNGVSRLFIDTNGSIGVGTTSPNALLTVAGDAYINGLTVGLGGNAVSSNTAIGFYALSTNQPTGTHNTAVGFYALSANVTGTDNTALGYSAGLATTSSTSACTFVGSSAGAGITGAYTTAIGYGTGLIANANSGNTLVGYQAGNQATSANNTLVGYNSGQAITSGGKNTIIGSYTGSAAPISSTASNYVVLSDGDGNVKIAYNATGVGFYVQPTPTSKAAVATLTGAEVLTQILNTTGTTYTVTMPTGTALDTATGGMNTDSAFDFSVINTASGTITIAVNTGITNVGSLSVPTGTSASYIIRKTSANTFVMYRM